MQFQVPQFIEVEDKIFGPLTFKQFIYVAGGAGAAYLLWRMLPLWLAGPLILSIGGLAAALAFLQWNGRPFILALENGFYYLIKSKLYLWSNVKRGNRHEAIGKSEVKPEQKPGVYIPRLADSKLHELAWSLDIKERIAAGVAEGREHIGGGVSPIRTSRDALVR
jgi:hypothetical protein